MIEKDYKLHKQFGSTMQECERWPRGTPYDSPDVIRTLRFVPTNGATSRSYTCPQCDYRTSLTERALRHCKVKNCRRHGEKETNIGLVQHPAQSQVENFSKMEHFLDWLRLEVTTDGKLDGDRSVYNDHYGLDETPQVLNKYLCRILRHLLRHGLAPEERDFCPRFLDIGSGCGRLAHALQSLPLRYTGVELSHRRVEAARQLLKAPAVNRHRQFRCQFVRQNFLSVKVAKFQGFHFVGFNVFWPRALELLAKSMCLLTSTRSGFGGCILLLLPASFWESSATRAAAHLRLQELLGVRLMGSIPITPMVRYVRHGKRFSRARMLPDSIFLYVGSGSGEGFRELVRGLVSPVKPIVLKKEDYGEELEVGMVY